MITTFTSAQSANDIHTPIDLTEIDLADEFQPVELVKPSIALCGTVCHDGFPLPAAVTIVDSPTPVTKMFSLSPENILEKSTAAQVSKGALSIKTCQTLKEFGNLLETLNPNQCVIYGVPPQDGLQLMSKAEWIKAGCPESATPRTTEAFKWPNGAGILMLDYDAPKTREAALTRDELFAMLHTAVPMLADAASLWMPSTSSEIYNAKTGDQLNGIKGQRIYLMLKDASDIPRTGQALLTHLWAVGQGRFEVSSSGSLLERGVFDSSVWQTNRIDFAGGALCIAPLEQRRGAPVFNQGKYYLVDSRAVVPDATPDIQLAADNNKAKAKAALAIESTYVRSAWTESRIKAFSSNNSSLLPDQAVDLVNRAIDRKQLLGDWLIHIIDGVNHESVVSVDQILNDPQKYHGMLTLDPLEPDYDGRRPVGKLFLLGRPYLNSFAHGGARFTLSKNLVRIENITGREHDAVNHLLRVMRESPDIFDFGSAVVTVMNGRLNELNESSLRYWTGGVVQFWHSKPSANNPHFEVLDNPSTSICKTVLSLNGQRNLKQLRSVITAPTLRQDGTVFDIAGYDATSGLLLDIEEITSYVPDCPTVEQAQKALDTLWFPFEKFPFVDELASAAHLAALLTAAIRPAVPTAPAFGYDAPTQGSGKTLLAQCVSILATGSPPEIYPHIGNDDAEMRKRLFSALLAGDRAIVLDNILGSFDSAAMASLLTAEWFKDRILGKSESQSVPNNAIVILTGNNMVLSGDMARRVLVCRIDPQIETPFGRSFDLNPLTYCMEHRQQMIAAALTLVRFYLTANDAQPASGRIASFEQWDDFVRQPIVHLSNTIASGQFGDILELIKQNQSEDPEQESLRDLLQALQACFGTKSFQAKDVVSACTLAWRTDSNESRLSEAVVGCLQRANVSAVSVGKMLTFRVDRISNGLQLKLANDNKNCRAWQIVGQQSS